jgi:hypothetical protein
MNYKQFYTEIANNAPPQSSVDKLFSKLLRSVFKSSNGIVGTDNIQDWIDEKLAIPLVMDLKTGKMEAYVSSMKPNTLELTEDYKSVTHFIMATKLIGVDKKYRYILIYPAVIVEYLFGNAHQYNIPEWRNENG